MHLWLRLAVALVTWRIVSHVVASLIPAKFPTTRKKHSVAKNHNVSNTISEDDRP